MYIYVDDNICTHISTTNDKYNSLPSQCLCMCSRNNTILWECVLTHGAALWLAVEQDAADACLTAREGEREREREQERERDKEK